MANTADCSANIAESSASIADLSACTAAMLDYIAVKSVNIGAMLANTE